MSNSQSSSPAGQTIYDFSPSKVTKFLLKAIGLLVVLNLVERVIVHWLNTQNQGQYVSIYFNFDQEANLPSLYSALTLGFCSYLLAVIATYKKNVKSKYTNHWKGLSFIFLFLAIDETCSIHELLIPILRGAINGKGLLYFPWVIPAFCLVIIFLIVFRRFILALPAKIKFSFLLAGFIYILGALGMELVGGYIADNYGYNTVYGIASSIEELLEMFGIVIFINALLTYLQSQTSELNFALSFGQQNRNKFDQKFRF
jgi:hypothetical protein